MKKEQLGNTDEPPSVVNRVVSRPRVYIGLRNNDVLPLYYATNGCLRIPIGYVCDSTKPVCDCGDSCE
jgi:hypothetical protein